jgi:hypothetical protein
MATRRRQNSSKVYESASPSGSLSVMWVILLYLRNGNAVRNRSTFNDVSLLITQSRSPQATPLEELGASIGVQACARWKVGGNVGNRL